MICGKLLSTHMLSHESVMARDRAASADRGVKGVSSHLSFT